MTYDRQIEAALQGISYSLELEPRAPIPCELLIIPLVRIGDALRLGLELPPPLRRWLGELEEADLRGAAALLHASTAWELPTRASDDDPFLGAVLRARDEAESFHVALRRICTPRRLDLYTWPEVSALYDAARAFDARVRALISPAGAVRLLGARSALHSVRVPSDESMTRYVTRGALPRYIEGVAGMDAVFAEDLEGAIDALVDAGEDVSPVALRWRARRNGATKTSP